MTARPSSAALLLRSMLLTAWEVPRPEQTDVAPSAAPTEAVTDAVADTVPAREPLSADSAIIRLDASDANLGAWQDRDIFEDPPWEPGLIEVRSVPTFFGLPIARASGVHHVRRR